MAISFDATTVGSAVAGNSTTFSHTCTGSDRYLVVYAGNDPASNDPTVVTYGGVSMTQLMKIGSKGYIYGLANPATGANDVVVTFGGGANHVNAIAVSYTGVSATGQPDSTGTQTGNGAGGITALSASTTTVADNSWALGFAYADPQTVSAGSNTTIRGQRNSGSYAFVFCDRNLATTPAGSTTLNLTFTNNTYPNFKVLSLSPNTATNVTVSATVQTATFSIPAYSVKVDVTTTPSAQVATFSIPAYTAKVDVSIAPSVQTAIFSIPSYTVTAIQNVTVSPSALTATFSVPAYTTTAIENVTVSPSVLTATFSVPTYSQTSDVSVSPSALTATFSIPVYDVIINDVVVTPTLQTLTFSVPAYTVDAIRHISVTPDVLTATFSIPAYTVVIDVSVAPSAQVATFSIPSYTATGTADISVTPTAQVCTFSIPTYTPAGIRNVEASVACQVLTFSVPTYTITTVRHVTISPETCVFTVTIPTYTITGDFWQNKHDTPATSWGNKY